MSRIVVKSIVVKSYCSFDFQSKKTAQAFKMCEAKWVICGIGAAAVILVILTRAIHFTSGGNNEISLGEGNNVANIK